MVSEIDTILCHTTSWSFKALIDSLNTDSLWEGCLSISLYHSPRDCFLLEWCKKTRNYMNHVLARYRVQKASYNGFTQLTRMCLPCCLDPFKTERVCSCPPIWSVTFVWAQKNWKQEFNQNSSRLFIEALVTIAKTWEQPKILQLMNG